MLLGILFFKYVWSNTLGILLLASLPRLLRTALVVVLLLRFRFLVDHWHSCLAHRWCSLVSIPWLLELALMEAPLGIF